MYGLIDVLIVGGGPAGLAAAIHLKKQLAALPDASVVVIDKAPRPGYHCLSGATFEPAALDELVPDWRDDRKFMEHVTAVQRDELYFLSATHAYRIPPMVVPRALDHRRDVTISLSHLAQFLAQRAERAGVEVYHGFSARTLLVEHGRVVGVALGELGRRADGSLKSNYRPAEPIHARVTILADGSRGVLSTQFRDHFGGGVNPQVYSLGIKAVVAFDGENRLGNQRVLHTLGYPNPATVFGGGFVYSMGKKAAAVGLIMGLDWKFGDLSPQQQFERFRAHPFMADLLHGAVTIATGAKTIPEGGYHALGTLAVPGAMLIGDAAGFVNMEKIKGMHYAMLSGMAAAEAVAEGLADGQGGTLRPDGYTERLEARGVLPDLRHARNYRQSFRWGLYAGAPLSCIQHWLPHRLGMRPDFRATQAGARLDRVQAGGMDGATFVRLSGSLHREDEPPHMSVLDPERCLRCGSDYAHACTHFCPGQVYRWTGDRLLLAASNCLHCMTCAVKCPLENISWLPPEGGEGPRFQQM